MHKSGLFTGTRAEYGLLEGLYGALSADGRMEPGWIVSGTHLDPAFGNTLEEIEAMKDKLRGDWVLASIKLVN